jgi:hypothetical protein
MLFQMLNLTQPMTDPPADSALEREVAGLFVAMNTMEMRMIAADTNLEIERVGGLQLNLKHSEAMDLNVALMWRKTMASLEKGMEEDFDIELLKEAVAYR